MTTIDDDDHTRAQAAAWADLARANLTGADLTTLATLATLPARYAQPDPTTLAVLPKPTKRDAEKGKCEVCGGWHGLPAVHLSYMGHAEVTLALIEADPLWTWRPVAFDHETGGPSIDVQGNRLVLWGYLTVCGVERMCVGTCEAKKDDPEKELIGDLLRNGAMRFGIGTKLWSKATDADPAGSGSAGFTRRREMKPVEPSPAEALFLRVKATAATPMADTLKALAAENGKALTANALAADEHWAALVTATLEEPS